MELPDLPPDYYWTNLQTVIGWVRAERRNLLHPEELGALDGWWDLPQPAQMAYGRFIQRRGPRHRISTWAYPEIEDLPGALELLLEREFIEADPPASMAERLEPYTVAELKAAAQRLGVEAGGRRAEVVEALLELDPERVSETIGMGEVRVARHLGAFDIARIVFFGTRWQSWHSFIVADLGLRKFADYAVARTPLFEDRAALDAYLAAGRRHDQAQEALPKHLLELGAVAAESIRSRAPNPPHRRHVDPTLEDERVVLAAAREKERAGDVEGALEDYRLLMERHADPRVGVRAFDRLGLVLTRAKRPEQARPSADALLALDLDVVSRCMIRKRLYHAGLGPDPRPELRKPPVREFALEQTGHKGPKALYGEGLTVEQAVLAEMGGDGVWCEGGLYTTLFTLLLWEVVFADVEGAFQHAFQAGPLDYDAPWFAARRRAGLDARLEALADLDLEAELARVHAENIGKSARGVGWFWPLETLLRVARTTGPALLAILRRLAAHPGRHRQGLPDLLLWRDGEVVLVEVKGPGDTPSTEQRLWHDYLLREGVPVELARVTRIGEVPVQGPRKPRPSGRRRWRR